VLDIGGRDVNGSPRSLFSLATEYCVVDICAGANVDVVADAAKWMPPSHLRHGFDVTLCTEVFEHTADWRGIVYNLWLTARRGGICLITCATDPRPAHSTVGLQPVPEGEWYANVDAGDLAAVLRMLFRRVEIAGHPRGDLYAWSVR
jgi:hypothetical protein